MKFMSNNVDFLLIGGGAAGLMAGLRAQKAGLDCLILEKGPEAGRKLCLTGGGRGNFLNTGCWSKQEAFTRAADAKRLRSMDRHFPQESIRQYFTSLGLPSKCEDHGRVFPVSEKASDTRDVLLENYLAAGGRIYYGQNISSLRPESSGLCAESKDGSLFRGRQALLAVGGTSFPRTGSSGDIARFAEMLGLSYKNFSPALCPLKLSSPFPADLAGISLEEAALTYSIRPEKGRKKRRITRRGALLFTKEGLSGPLILNSSADLSEEGNFAEAELNLLPDEDENSLRQRLTEEAESKPKRLVKTYLRSLLPARLADSLWAETCRLSGAAEGLNFASLSKKQMNILLKVLLSRPVRPLDPPSAAVSMVSRGGILPDEINWRSMELRPYKGIYIAGECIDIDFISGGFQLCFAFQSGALAAYSAVSALKY